jgi:hypothetical protein
MLSSVFVLGFHQNSCHLKPPLSEDCIADPWERRYQILKTLSDLICGLHRIFNATCCEVEDEIFSVDLQVDNLQCSFAQEEPAYNEAISSQHSETA